MERCLNDECCIDCTLRQIKRGDSIMADRFMELSEAMEIVYDLAMANAVDEREIKPELVEEREKQQLALDTVHDFIVNNLSD